MIAVDIYERKKIQALIRRHTEPWPEPVLFCPSIRWVFPDNVTNILIFCFFQRIIKTIVVARRKTHSTGKTHPTGKMTQLKAQAIQTSLEMKI